MSKLVSGQPDGEGVHVAPDPRLVSSIGSGHKLETAVADIVDNSIDFGARNVLVRFLIDEESVKGLMIIDDGTGMNEADIDKAMKYGGQDHYESGSLGHFGVGLKASAMSQGDEMSVFSKRKGYVAQGRWMSRESVDAADPLVKSYRLEEVQSYFDEVSTDFDLEQGTIVVITRPRNFVSDGDPEEVQSWLSSSVDKLDRHLGGIHHRALESQRTAIQIDQYDIEYEESGSALGISPRNPFAHAGSGVSGFPTTFAGSIDGHDFEYHVDIWPSSGAREDNFVIGVNNTDDGQGFYIYRSNRLLQAGGWNELISPSMERRFIRIALEVDDVLENYVRMNPEKNGIEFTGPFRQALKKARSRDGRLGFDDILLASATTQSVAKSRTRQERLIVKPESGLDRRIVDAMSEQIGFDDEHSPVRILWERLTPERVFEVLPSERKLILNNYYHDDLTKLGKSGKPAGSKQAPLITTLIYLSARQDLERTVEGARWRSEQDAIQRVMVEAIYSQREWERRMGLSADGTPGSENVR